VQLKVPPVWPTVGLGAGALQTAAGELRRDEGRSGRQHVVQHHVLCGAGPLLVTRIVYDTFEPAATGSGLSVLVIARSALD
jgi:hypothetical protein